jgi:hypothetical protein
MHKPRGCFAITKNGPYVFVFGGIKHIKYSEYTSPEQQLTVECEKYNSETNEWIQLAPMLEPVKNSSAISAS